MPDLLLDIKGLESQFRTPHGIIHAVNGVAFGLKEGETLGVVGESGCGKSVTMLSVLGLIPTPPGKILAGEALFFGQDLLKLSKVSNEIDPFKLVDVGLNALNVKLATVSGMAEFSEYNDDATCLIGSKNP